MRGVREHLLSAILFATGCSESQADAPVAAPDPSTKADLVGLPAGDPVAPDGNCLEIIVDSYISLMRSPAVACRLAHAKYFGDADRAQQCADACGDPLVNWCEVPDLYWFDYELAVRADDAGPTTCPASEADASVRIACERIHMMELAYGPPCGNGRRPEGLAPFERRESSIGSYLAECAYLEEASIASFERLATELDSFAAPPELRDRARAAARDEVRHARIFASLARHHGGRLRKAARAPHVERDLLAFTIENAVEGVVRETYGAASLLLSARRAQGKKLRSALSRIADDECRHALLSRDIDAWARTRLDADGSRKRRAAISRATQELRSSIADDEPAPELRRVLGLPSAEEGARITASLEHRLWIDNDPASARAPLRRRSDVT